MRLLDVLNAERRHAQDVHFDGQGESITYIVEMARGLNIAG